MVCNSLCQSSTSPNIMVLLTITPVMAEALKRAQSESPPPKSESPCPKEFLPSYEDSQPGKPISHKQILQLWQELRDSEMSEYTLDKLLRGSQIYVTPLPPKPEPKPEYKALMARLREQEEERKYQRMMSPPKIESFTQRYPNAAHFAEVNRARAEDIGNDEEGAYEQVQRQLMLILNFIISIVGVAATLWIVARWWSTPARLALSMGGALVVGIAEVAVYSAFVWRVDQSDQKSKRAEKRIKEVRSVAQTWIVDKNGVREEGNKAKDHDSVPEAPGVDEDTANSSLRRRIVSSI